MASTKLRKSCSFPNLILTFLNFFLFIFSLTSIAPIIILKMPPTSLAFAFLMVSFMSLISSFIGFYSQCTHSCFVTHLSLLFSSSIGQLFTVLTLFTKENYVISSLKSDRGTPEIKFLVRLECGVFMVMVLLQMLVLVLSCALHSCWVREYEGLEEKREATDMKKRERIARVYVESMANAEKIADKTSKEFDEKMNNKCGVMGSV